MKKYIRNWNLTRIIRLAMGIMITIQGIQANEWMLIVLGGFFALMPIFNLGCSSTNGCSVPAPKAKNHIGS